MVIILSHHKPSMFFLNVMSIVNNNSYFCERKTKIIDINTIIVKMTTKLVERLS